MFTGLWLKLAGLLAGLFGILGAAFMVRKSGADANELKHVDADREAKARVDAAEAQAPGSHDELVDHLRKGGRL